METFVASRADLLHLDQERVAVAVKCDVLDGLSVGAGFALHPELLARPAPEMGLAGLNGRFERGAGHPGHHADAARLLRRDGAWDQAIGIKLQFIVKAHSCESTVTLT